MAAEAYCIKLRFRRFSKLFAVSVIFDFENIHPSSNIEGKYPFKPLCWNVNTNCDMLMLRSIAPAINLKTAGKYYFQVFFVLFPWLFSPAGIYGTRLLPLMLLTTTARLAQPVWLSSGIKNEK